MFPRRDPWPVMEYVRDLEAQVRGYRRVQARFRWASFAFGFLLGFWINVLLRFLFR